MKMASPTTTRKVSRGPKPLRAGIEIRGRGRGGQDARKAEGREAESGARERTLRKGEEPRCRERPKPTAQRAQAPRASPGNREPIVTTTTNLRCSWGQSCPHCGLYTMDSAPSPHDDGLSLSNRGLTLYSDLDDLYCAVRHVLDRTFQVTFMEQRPSPPPRSYLEVARRLPYPQAPSSSPPMRSVPTSCHSRGASQPLRTASHLRPMPCPAPSTRVMEVMVVLFLHVLRLFLFSLQDHAH